MENKEHKRLMELREKSGYSHMQMAKMLGISKSYYWLVEKGERNIYYDLAKKIAAIFNMKPDDIFYEDEQ